jgi:ribosome recycling factor
MDMIKKAKLSKDDEKSNEKEVQKMIEETEKVITKMLQTKTKEILEN